MEKSNLWWPTPASADTDAGYPPALQRITSTGHNVLKSQIGMHRYLTEKMERRAENLKPKFKDIVDLNDAHISFSLLSSCMGVCQLNYLLRTVPPTVTKLGARLYDSFMHDALNEFTGGMMPTDSFSEL
eukprot:IDg10571t1